MQKVEVGPKVETKAAEPVETKADVDLRYPELLQKLRDLAAETGKFTDSMASCIAAVEYHFKKEGK